MIEGIIIKNGASYSDEGQNINNLKKINFFMVPTVQVKRLYLGLLMTKINTSIVA